MTSNWTFAFLVLALLAFLLGFAGLGGTAGWIARAMLVLFLALSLASWLFSRRRHEKIKPQPRHTM